MWRRATLGIALTAGSGQLQDRYVSSLSVGPQGIVTVIYRGEPALEGRTLVLTPVLVSGDYAMSWSCSGGTVAAELSSQGEPRYGGR